VSSDSLVIDSINSFRPLAQLRPKKRKEAKKITEIKRGGALKARAINFERCEIIHDSILLHEKTFGASFTEHARVTRMCRGFRAPWGTRQGFV